MTKEERQGCLLIGAMFAVVLAFLVLCFCFYGVFLAIDSSQPKNVNKEFRK